MLTLALLRHAKSSWDDPSLGDFDRPLNTRGLKNAPEAGMALRELGLRPDLILCSSANRTRATLDLALPELRGPAPKIHYEEALYHASAGQLLDRLRLIGDGPSNVLLVGHNPGLHALAITLAGTGKSADLSLMQERYPTAAIAYLTFEAPRWRDIGPAKGRLEDFWTPRRLRE
jgi:phosphohistidine phosphatase